MKITEAYKHKEFLEKYSSCDLTDFSVEELFEHICFNFGYYVREGPLEEWLPDNVWCNELDLVGCHNIECLPKYLNCNNLLCINCVNLKYIPETVVYRRANFSNCRSLKNIPKNKCQWLLVNGCDNLVKMPELSFCRSLACDKHHMYHIRNKINLSNLKFLQIEY